MPLDSKQLKILKRLGAHLEGINPENADPGDTADDSYVSAPYSVDLRAKVFRGRSVFGQESIVPFLSLLESPQPITGVGVGYDRVVRAEQWSILLQGFVVDDKENPTDPAYLLKAQVDQRLARIIQVKPDNGEPAYPAEYLLGNLIMSLTIGQGVVRPPDEKVSSKAFFYIPLVIELKTDTSNPYAD